MNKSDIEKMKVEYADARFKNKEEVLNYLNQDRIPCLICGKTYKALGTHLQCIHGMTADEYKEIFNIPWSKGLVSPSTRQYQSNNLSRRIQDGSIPQVDVKVLIESRTNVLRRKPKDYHSKYMQDLARTAHRNNSKKKVLKILDVMEENRCTVWEATKLLGMTNYALVNETIAYFPELKERYDQVCAQVLVGVARKTNMSYDEIREQIFQLRLSGMTNKDIAQKLNIGEATVKRAIVKKGSFSNCKDTTVEHVPVPVIPPKVVTNPNISAIRKKSTREKAIRILDAMEEHMLPAIAACRLSGMPKIYALNDSMKYFPDIRERYDKIQLMVKEHRRNEARENRKLKRRKCCHV